MARILKTDYTPVITFKHITYILLQERDILVIFGN